MISALSKLIARNITFYVRPNMLLIYGPFIIIKRLARPRKQLRHKRRIFPKQSKILKIHFVEADEIPIFSLPLDRKWLYPIRKRENFYLWRETVFRSSQQNVCPLILFLALTREIKRNELLSVPFNPPVRKLSCHSPNRFFIGSLYLFTHVTYEDNDITHHLQHTNLLNLNSMTGALLVKFMNFNFHAPTTFKN